MISVIASGVCFMMIIYCLYQLVRNEKVYKILSAWRDANDIRCSTYNYNYMFNPKKNNWFGLRWPQDNQYEVKK